MSTFLVACHLLGSQLLDSLIAEAVAGRPARDEGDVGVHGVVDVLPVEWVVDIADKDNDWFVATAYTYNGAPGVIG